MINATNSKLYNLQSKKNLIYLLKIHDKDFFNQDYVAAHIHPYIDKRGKPRLIESPSLQLKKIQRNLKNELAKIEVPYNVFSGIKGKSYVENAEMHRKSNYIFKIDLTAFFPCIPRESVYTFFRKQLKTSPDIAQILTNLTTVDLTRCNIKKLESIEKFILDKHIVTTNHLISGSPTSQALSYLVNTKMFDELQYLCDKNKVIMSIYVDDITFSSNHKISHKFKEIVYTIISKYMFKLSHNKIKYYTKDYPKLVTGPVISNGKLIIRNSLRFKIISEFKSLKKNPNKASYDRLKGLIVAAKQIDLNQYPNISKYIKENPIH
ncbi:MAG: reverse transcriptase family protein [Clostridiales bacterium]|nr:reverse transcriptase family protein [Clostridiales bacterium]